MKYSQCLRRVLTLEHMGADQMCRVMQGERRGTPVMALMTGVVGLLGKNLDSHLGLLLNNQFITLVEFYLDKFCPICIPIYFLFFQKCQSYFKQWKWMPLSNKPGRHLPLEMVSTALWGWTKLFCLCVLLFSNEKKTNFPTSKSICKDRYRLQILEKEKRSYYLI